MKNKNPWPSPTKPANPTICPDTEIQLTPAIDAEKKTEARKSVMESPLICITQFGAKKALFEIDEYVSFDLIDYEIKRTMNGKTELTLKINLTSTAGSFHISTI